MHVFRTMSLNWFAAIVVAAIVNMSPALNAQTFVTPAVDDRELYVSVLHFVHQMNSYAANAGSEQTVHMQRALCRELNVNVADLVRISALADSAETTFWAGGPKIFADENSRHSNTDQIIAQLSFSLSPEGWKNFHLFVNGPFREKVVMIRGVK